MLKKVWERIKPKRSNASMRKARLRRMVEELKEKKTRSMKQLEQSARF